MKRKLSFPKEKIKILLLEGIHPAAEESFRAADYPGIEKIRGALSEEELLRRVAGVHILGIRSKTAVTSRVIQAAPHLLAIGCFCIGTDQVDIEAATRSATSASRSPTP
jgi:D-3-phosphoglycerate dehydrogenase